MQTETLRIYKAIRSCDPFPHSKFRHGDCYGHARDALRYARILAGAQFTDRDDGGCVVDLASGHRIVIEADPYYEPDGDYDVERERSKLESGEWSVWGWTIYAPPEPPCAACGHQPDPEPADSCWGFVESCWPNWSGHPIPYTLADAIACI